MAFLVFARSCVGDRPMLPVEDRAYASRAEWWPFDDVPESRIAGDDAAEPAHARTLVIVQARAEF